MTSANSISFYFVFQINFITIACLIWAETLQTVKKFKSFVFKPANYEGYTCSRLDPRTYEFPLHDSVVLSLLISTREEK
jgi:hypothetical protein